MLGTPGVIRTPDPLLRRQVVVSGILEVKSGADSEAEYGFVFKVGTQAKPSRDAGGEFGPQTLRLTG
jgi:hypothetical protein